MCWFCWVFFTKLCNAQGFWKNVLDRFLDFRLRVPIQTLLFVVPTHSFLACYTQFKQSEHTPEMEVDIYDLNTINFTTSRVSNRTHRLSLCIVTVCNSSCEKVMFSQAPIILSTGGCTPPPPERPLQRTARILLEFILVQC